MKSKYTLVFLFLLLGGCATPGILCDPDTAHSCGKYYCFYGNIHADAGSPMASGGAMGQIWSVGFVEYGEGLDSETSRHLIDQGCDGEGGGLPEDSVAPLP